MKHLLESLPDKTEYKNTTSLKFKEDLIEFFRDKELDTCLEIGTNHGHTTFILSHLFNHVYTIDLYESNIEKAKEVNKDRVNIKYITGDAYDIENFKDVPKVDVAFIDCMHTFDGVLKDTQTSLLKCSEEGMYLIFDDYAHPASTGVYDAIEHIIPQGLKREAYIGEDKGFTFSKQTNPTTLIRQEGIILSYGK
tara:strand:+ start:57 stop:638 length:582 start_codon:yes stop_codon:yes gene_type:complete